MGGVIKCNLTFIWIFARYGTNVTERKQDPKQNNPENKKVFRKQYSESNIGNEIEKDNGVLIVKELLENEKDKKKQKPNKANINEKDTYDLTPLHHAALR